MKTILTASAIILICILVSGCASAKKTFYWGDYSSTLYDFKKSPDAKTKEAHLSQLRRIMEVSNKQQMNVPPGVYVEYGYYLLKDGNEAEGMSYLAKETDLYPESVIFINRIKAEYARGKQ